METVLFVGVTGQDGSYLSKLLLEKGLHVVGTSRDASVCDKSKLEKIGVDSSFVLLSNINYTPAELLTWIWKCIFSWVLK